MVERVKLDPMESRRLPRRMSEVRRRQNAVEYDDHRCDMAFKFCVLGATKAQVAVFLGVSESCIDKWMESWPEFKEAIERGREEADAQVAHGLYRRAIGYTLTHVETREGENGTGPFWAKTTKYEHIPPDTAAAIRFLVVRRRDLWALPKDMAEDTGGTITVKIEGGLPTAQS